MLSKKFVVLNLVGLLVLLLNAPVDAQEAQSVSFETHIKPILENHCISCHGPEKEEGTRLDIRDDAMDYIEVGDPENSDFYAHLISDDEEELMPPTEEENPLTAERIALVKTWISEGAEWPDGIEVIDARTIQIQMIRLPTTKAWTKKTRSNNRTPSSDKPEKTKNKSAKTPRPPTTPCSGMRSVRSTRPWSTSRSDCCWRRACLPYSAFAAIS